MAAPDAVKTTRTLLARLKRNPTLTSGERAALFAQWLSSEPWNAGDALRQARLGDSCRTLSRELLHDHVAAVFGQLFSSTPKALAAFVPWFLQQTRADVMFFTRPQVGWTVNAFGPSHHRGAALLAQSIEQEARRLGVPIPDAFRVPDMPYLQVRTHAGSAAGGSTAKPSADSARPAEDRCFQYLLWGRTGYEGNDDMNDPAIAPCGALAADSAQAIKADMERRCDDYSAKQANLVENREDLEWTGPETWSVVMVSLPQVIKRDSVDTSPFVAIRATLEREAAELSIDVDEHAETFIEACEVDVSGGAHAQHGYHEHSAGLEDQVRSELDSELRQAGRHPTM